MSEKQKCTHKNKAYGDSRGRERPWICRDCGMQGHVADALYDKDYYDTLLRHVQAGTAHGKEFA